MRTLIFGSDGQLGRDLMALFKNAGPVAGYDLPGGDVCEDESLQPLVDETMPDLIVNAAAYTDVEGAEDDIERAYMVNQTGARNLAELSAHLNIPIVYFSTDYVFDGRSEVPYKPYDPVNPLSVYGKSKAAGESDVMHANPYHYIVRTSRLFGPGGNNFVEKVLRAAKERDKLQMIETELSRPTHTLDLAEATLALVRQRKYGIYHAANEGACTPLEFARAILEIAEIDTPVEAVHPDDVPRKAARPTYSVLDTTSLEETAGFEFRPWKDTLFEYLQRREAAV